MHFRLSRKTMTSRTPIVAMGLEGGKYVCKYMVWRTRGGERITARAAATDNYCCARVGRRGKSAKRVSRNKRRHVCARAAKVARSRRRTRKRLPLIFTTCLTSPVARAHVNKQNTVYDTTYNAEDPVYRRRARGIPTPPGRRFNDSRFRPDGPGPVMTTTTTYVPRYVTCTLGILLLPPSPKLITFRVNGFSAPFSTRRTSPSPWRRVARPRPIPRTGGGSRVFFIFYFFDSWHP